MAVYSTIEESRKRLSIIMESKSIQQAKPFFAIIMMQFLYALFAVICSSALSKGMNNYTFAVYRNTVATLVIAPFALFFERNTRPKMTFSVLYKILLLGLLEPVIDQNLYYIGMQHTTATFATSMNNALPAITFIIACIVRLEKLNIRKLPTQAKILGTMVTVGGTMIMTLLKGPLIRLPWTHRHTGPVHDSIAAIRDPVLGTCLVATGCICWSLFYNLQAIVQKAYPAGLSLTAMICMAGALQGTVVTLVVERGKYEIWAINWDIKLLAFVYGGVICSALWYYVSGMIMKEKGPVFVTAFNPLSTVIVAVMSSFMFHEELEVGKVIGAAVIVCGLYMVIWGKSKDPQNSQSEVVDDKDVSTMKSKEDLDLEKCQSTSCLETEGEK